MNNIPKLIVILGPTASGKSALGMELAQQYDGEIICADSRTIYKGMDIGTAKPTLEDQKQVPHYLLDVVNPDEAFSAADFQTHANAAIADISGRGKVPIMVGGSGLYIDSILFNYKFPAMADATERNILNKMNIDELRAELKKINPEKYELIDINNPRRVIRAIEITNNPNSGLIKSETMRAHTMVIGIDIPKNVLIANIRERIVFMLNNGLIAEVEDVITHYGNESEAMSGNAYRIVSQAIINHKNNSEIIDELIRADEKLVKKQLTWFRKNPNINWVQTATQAEKLVADFLQQTV
jgi:tRNA dimethylallyltransferase